MELFGRAEHVGEFLPSLSLLADLVRPAVDENAGRTVLALPVAAFEIVVLPAWLFLRGFKMPEEPTTV